MAYDKSGIVMMSRAYRASGVVNVHLRYAQGLSITLADERGIGAHDTNSHRHRTTCKG